MEEKENNAFEPQISDDLSWELIGSLESTKPTITSSTHSSSSQSSEGNKTFAQLTDYERLEHKRLEMRRMMKQTAEELNEELGLTGSDRIVVPTLTIEHNWKEISSDSIGHSDAGFEIISNSHIDTEDLANPEDSGDDNFHISTKDLLDLNDVASSEEHSTTVSSSENAEESEEEFEAEKPKDYWKEWAMYERATITEGPDFPPGSAKRLIDLGFWGANGKAPPLAKPEAVNDKSDSETKYEVLSPEEVVAHNEALGLDK